MKTLLDGLASVNHDHRKMSLSTTYLWLAQEKFGLVTPEAIVLSQTGSRQEIMHYILLEYMLLSVLEHPGAFSKIQTEGITKHQNSMMTDINDGKAIVFRENTIYFYFYTDDLELWNPLGFQCGPHKMFIVYYYTIRNFPGSFGTRKKYPILYSHWTRPAMKIIMTIISSYASPLILYQSSLIG